MLIVLQLFIQLAVLGRLLYLVLGMPVIKGRKKEEPALILSMCSERDALRRVLRE